MRTAWPLVLLSLAACSRAPAARESDAGVPAPETPPAAAPLALEPVRAATRPADPLPGTGGAGSPLLVRTEGGLVPGAAAERVLHVGDSMAPLVGNYLRPLYSRHGRNYWVETVVSSSTLEWAGKRLLQDAMYKYDPDLVLISLGSNELFDPRPERRAAAIRQIVADTRGRACLWIGPPAWKRDSGFTEVLKKNLGSCRYLDSAALDLPRMQDGRHPSWTGGHRWASAVWKALGGTEPVPTFSPKPG